MSDNTKIEWSDATWNPATGCSKVSEACRNCYALRDWVRMAANQNSVYYDRQFTDVMCHPERLDQPIRWQKPRMIFVNSMSDLFHEAVPDEFIDQVFAVMAIANQHVFQILTKRPLRMREYLTKRAAGGRYIWQAGQQIKMSRGRSKPETSWPLPNVWLGVSIENQQAADERIPLLLSTPAAVRWISAEPLLGQLDLTTISVIDGDPYFINALRGEMRITESASHDLSPVEFLNKLDWVVVGGESGENARPMHPDWVRSIKDQCNAANIPFLFKQWGEFTEIDGPVCRGSFSRNREPGDFYMDSDGTIIPFNDDLSKQGGSNFRSAWTTSIMRRVGKKSAGRLLDGKFYDNYPDAQIN
ncbi:phage Gp37/Gp68 family protein (plasmid) [Methylomarinum sp. Ch1-1]|uniref:Phage Gp37/Gp68 family protein n=1 Tax=Methylomarinum roseum TaxID=3067653 RepID=A0AAU7NZY8_9GAMM|nr:phage Gp37/Gp68 family protein [Methylomarinum sp. Ch1-1]MDP4523257.1 phage Gp37/Gp68 family protein [Methylomarinum sp. Ch1-1]